MSFVQGLFIVRSPRGLCQYCIFIIGLTPSDIREFLRPIFDEEQDLEGGQLKRPKVTVSYL